MPSVAVGEINYNPHLADLLRERMPGWEALPQSRRITGRDGDKVPDVMISAPDGADVVLEAKMEKTGAAAALDKQTQAHIENGSPVAVAVIYPACLSKSAPSLREELEGERKLRFAAWTEGGNGPERFPEKGYLTGGLDRLADFVEAAARSKQKAARLTEMFSESVSAAADILDRRFPPMAEVVKQRPGRQTDEMMSALILNALIFHYQVAANYPEIDPPLLCSAGIGRKQAVLRQWDAILEINYWPIFKIASQILKAIGDEKTANQFLGRLMETASRMADEDAHTVQNLAGHVFGALLADRKFLASFYTLPAPAALLAEMAVSRLSVDWGDAEAVGNLKVADFACGSGALLTAVYRRIRSRVRRRGINDSGIHRKMLEHAFVGCDVMPAAVHITAATLSSAHPRIDYTGTETHVMPIGPYKVADRDDVRAGSLELLGAEDTGTLFGDGSEMVTAAGSEGSGITVKTGSCDIVIMNPPYTTPTNHTRKDRQQASHPQFAAFGMDKKMQKKIDAKVRRMTRKLKKSAADGNAGIATNFFDLAHLKLKAGGGGCWRSYCPPPRFPVPRGERCATSWPPNTKM